MRLNTCCVNEMASFGLFASIAKGKTTFDRVMTQKEVCPRDRIANLLGTNVLLIDNDMVSLKVSCIFAHCVVCNRRRRDLLGIVGSIAVRSWDRQGKKPCVSYLRRSELSAQVRQHNSYTYYSQRTGERVPMAPRPKRFVVR